MANSQWKFPELPVVLQQKIELPRVLHALRSGQTLSQQDRAVLISLIEKLLTPAADRKAAEAEKGMWRDWRLAFLDLLAGGQSARRKSIAAAFPAEAEITSVTVKNARARFDAEVTALRNILIKTGGQTALKAQGEDYIDTLIWDFNLNEAGEKRLLELIAPD